MEARFSEDTRSATQSEQAEAKLATQKKQAEERLVAQKRQENEAHGFTSQNFFAALAFIPPMTPFVIIPTTPSKSHQPASRTVMTKVITQSKTLDAAVAASQPSASIQGPIKQSLTEVTTLYLEQLQARKNRIKWYAGGYFTGALGLCCVGLAMLHVAFAPAVAFGIVFVSGVIAVAAFIKNEKRYDRLKRIHANISRLESLHINMSRLESLHLEKNPTSGAIVEKSKEVEDFIIKLRNFVVALDKIDFSKTFGSRCFGLLGQIESVLVSARNIDVLRGSISGMIATAFNTASTRAQRFFGGGEEVAFQNCCRSSGLMILDERVDQQLSPKI